MEAAGSSLSLRCVVGGVPPPAKRWLRAGNPLHPVPPFQLEGDALLIRGIQIVFKSISLSKCNSIPLQS